MGTCARLRRPGAAGRGRAKCPACSAVLTARSHAQAGAAGQGDRVPAMMERCLLGGASAGAQGRGALGGAAAAGGRWGAPAGEGGSGRRPTSMRPSMEMRRRKLDTSMLQARAHRRTGGEPPWLCRACGGACCWRRTTLINQTVAKKT